MEINIKSIEENIDFKHKIKRKEFEQLIYEEINDFKKKFKSFYNKVKRYEPEKIIIGNQLMNTPILEKIIKEISHLPILKTINFNECHSLGSLLYETFILENNKFEELEYVKSYNMYSIYYSINNSNKQLLIKKGENIPNEGSINLNNIEQLFHLKKQSNYIVNLNVFYDKNEFEKLGIDKIKNFYTYNIDLNNLNVKNKILFLDYSINESNELILKLNNSNILDFGLKINIKNSFSNKAIIKSYKELEKYFKTKDKNI
jgi:molecular chaperone DnaK (HSP70)